MIATRFLPPLVVIAAIALPAALLRPARTLLAEEPRVVDPRFDDLPPSHFLRGEPERSMTAREREVEGCFLEWEERASGDVSMIVRVDIDPEGIATADVFGGPDSPMLRLCVREAILRTQYPIGHTLSLDLHVDWTAKRLDIFPALIEPQRQPSTAEMHQKLEELKRERARLLRELAERRARAH